MVVRDNAIVQGGAKLSGSVVIGGDAEPAWTCGSGTYLLFSSDRGCDGRVGETDVNPAYAGSPTTSSRSGRREAPPRAAMPSPRTLSRPSEERSLAPRPDRSAPEPRTIEPSPSLLLR